MQTPQPQPRPASTAARLEQNERGWSIWLSSDATVVELAALLGGLRKIGHELEAHDLGAGAFVLFPVNRNSSAPHALDIAECIATFRGPLPKLRAVL